MKKKKSSPNYLDFVPAVSKQFQSKTDDEGVVTIFVENKGVFHRLAQTFLKKPAVTQVHLDAMGSFIWQKINGSSTLYEIAQEVSAQFGAEAEPLYDRLLTYIKRLESYGFISLNKQDASQQNP